MTGLSCTFTSARVPPHPLPLVTALLRAPRRQQPGLPPGSSRGQLPTKRAAARPDYGTQSASRPSACLPPIKQQLCRWQGTQLLSAPRPQSYCLPWWGFDMHQIGQQLRQPCPASSSDCHSPFRHPSELSRAMEKYSFSQSSHTQKKSFRAKYQPGFVLL